LAEDAAKFHRLMNTQPRDDLEVGDVLLDAAHVAELDNHLSQSGRHRWTLFLRDPGGACVGGTEITFDEWDPTIASQQNTAVDPQHRGRGLAKWAKAAMLARLHDEQATVVRIRTGNAFSNDAMLAINTALGFSITEVRTEWQGSVADLATSIAR
jgi:RimJ/RimL family protein N-acetyltransferase